MAAHSSKHQNKLTSNPFSLVFGKCPSAIIERPMQVEEIVQAFTAKEIAQQIFMITGVRGFGKTVLMTSVAKRIAANKEWVHIELNPTLDLLSSLLSKLNSNKTCLEILKGAKLNLSFFGFSVSFSGAAEIKDKEVAIAEILKNFKKHNKRLLITIDEATNTQQMRTFASTFQILVRQDLPIFLIMTGLYNNISNLQNAENLTFLYRAPKIHLQPLNVQAVANEYKKIFELGKKAAQNMAELTRGYPFAFQLLGYLTWQNGSLSDNVLESYELYLAEYVYDKIWSELSARDRQVCQAIAKCGEGATSSVLAESNITQNQFNPYRKRLLQRGVVRANARGSLCFTLPAFNKYCLAN